MVKGDPVYQLALRPKTFKLTIYTIVYKLNLQAIEVLIFILWCDNLLMIEWLIYLDPDDW